MRTRAALLLAVLLLPGVVSSAHAQPLWQVAAATAARAAEPGRVFTADVEALRAALSRAPGEGSGDRSYRLALPMPDGTTREFGVVESPVMAPALAARYPEIRTYRVYSTADGGFAGRIALTPLGFSGLVDTEAGQVHVNPRDFRSGDDTYLVSYRRDVPRAAFRCGSESNPYHMQGELAARFATANRVAGSLLHYDLAVAATYEYHAFFAPPFAPNTQGAIDATTAAIVATVNAVNLVYERDLGIHLDLVADNDQLYETTDSGSLTNGDDFALLGEVNGWIDSHLPGGDSAYDIGHVFYRPSVGGGGLANIGAVCDDAIKAGGVSGLPNPGIGKLFDIDLVAHEIGHQFGAEHSFNGTAGACVTGRSRLSAVEPGSGSSIMAYAGLCGAEDLQGQSDANFHAGSIAEINSYTAAAGACYTLAPNGNSDPVVAAVDDRSIPAGTAFVLDGSATDPDLDTLEYQWDQVDAGCPTDAASFGGDNGSNALFRSYNPRAQTWRHFPALGTQVQGLYDKAEVLPCNTRDLDFRLTVRDGNSGQGTENVRLAVTSAAGPFVVTSVTPTTVNNGAPMTVVWNVANTDQPPVNCANVDIDLIAFSAAYLNHTIYPLQAGAPNNGSAMVSAPAAYTHPRARIRVKCSDNYFYGLSSTNLSLNGTNPTPIGDTDFKTYINNTYGTTGLTPPSCSLVDCTPPDTGSGSRNGDSSAVDPWWLALLAGFAALAGFRRRQGLQ